MFVTCYRHAGPPLERPSAGSPAASCCPSPVPSRPLNSSACNRRSPPLRASWQPAPLPPSLPRPLRRRHCPTPAGTAPHRTKQCAGAGPRPAPNTHPHKRPASVAAAAWPRMCIACPYMCKQQQLPGGFEGATAVDAAPLPPFPLLPTHLCNRWPAATLAAHWRQCCVGPLVGGQGCADLRRQRAARVGTRWAGARQGVQACQCAASPQGSRIQPARAADRRPQCSVMHAAYHRRWVQLLPHGRAAPCFRAGSRRLTAGLTSQQDPRMHPPPPECTRRPPPPLASAGTPA